MAQVTVLGDRLYRSEKRVAVLEHLMSAGELPSAGALPSMVTAQAGARAVAAQRLEDGDGQTLMDVSSALSSLSSPPCSPGGMSPSSGGNSSLSSPGDDRATIYGQPSADSRQSRSRGAALDGGDNGGHDVTSGGVRGGFKIYGGPLRSSGRSMSTAVTTPAASLGSTAGSSGSGGTTGASSWGSVAMAGDASAAAESLPVGRGILT